MISSLENANLKGPLAFFTATPDPRFLLSWNAFIDYVHLCPYRTSCCLSSAETDISLLQLLAVVT
jgi:hypothetical protein